MLKYNEIYTELGIGSEGILGEQSHVSNAYSIKAKTKDKCRPTTLGQ